MSLGYGADILLKRFSEELARNVGKRGIGFGEVYDEIRNNEQAVLARSVSQDENIAILYSNMGSRDRIVSTFFEPVERGGTMAALIEKSSDLPPSVTRITYGELQAGRRMALNNSVIEWVSAVHPAGLTLRLAKGNTWFVENGMAEPSHDALGARKTALLCAYDLSKIDSASAGKAAELHDFVIVEGTQGIYTRR